MAGSSRTSPDGPGNHSPMSRSQRVLASALLGTVALGTVLYFTYRSRAAQTGAMPELITLAPADAPILLYADVAALRAAPFFQRLLAAAPTPQLDPEYMEFVRETGFDYTRDLDRILAIGWTGSSASDGIVVAEGRFDRARLSSYARRKGRVESHNGIEVYIEPLSGARAGTTAAFAFLDDHRIAFGDLSRLETLLTVRDSSGPSTAMRARVRRVAGSAVFVVAKADSLPQNASAGGLRSHQFDNLTRSLRWVSLGARSEGDRLDMAIEGECDTPENAQQLAGTLDGLRMMSQAALADPKTHERMDPQLVAWFESLLRVLNVSREDQRVRLTLQVTGEMMDRFPANSARSTPSR